MNPKLKNNLTILFAILFLSVSRINLAQVNTAQLEHQAEKTIEDYYIEPYKVSASSDGIITINGITKTLFDKLRIGELVSQVDRVRGINNKIEVQVETTPDAIIKANINDELELNNVILEPKNIVVDVKNGVVNLSGTVSYFREKLMAQSIASWQDGVIDMTSSIKVLPPLAAQSDENIKQVIADILQKNFSLERNVTYKVNNGIVIFEGNVRSLFAKDHIAEEVQHLLGVKEVINVMTVQQPS